MTLDELQQALLDANNMQTVLLKEKAEKRRAAILAIDAELDKEMGYGDRIAALSATIDSIKKAIAVEQERIAIEQALNQR